MKQLIDKAVLVAEIEKRIKGLKDCHADTIAGYAGEISGLERLLSFIDTLEVKEVDLEKEIQDHIKECLDVKFSTTDVELIKKDVANTARKFFKLGLKAKGEYE